MCRYAEYGPYREKRACFRCRKSFKQTSRYDLAHPMSVAEDGERLVLCPQCGERMHNMGLDFKAPKQTDIEQWKKVELLHHHGYAFHSCGCSGPGPRPNRLREVEPFLEEQQCAVAEVKRKGAVGLRAEQLEAKRKKAAEQRRDKLIGKVVQAD